MTTLEIKPTAFNSTLPFYVPPPVTGDAITQYSAGAVPAGAVTSWPASAGGTAPMEPVSTAPVMALQTISASPVLVRKPAVVFTGAETIRAGVENPLGATGVGTVYIVFEAAAAGLGTKMCLIDFNGVFVTIEAGSKTLRPQGSASTVVATGGVITATRIAAAITFDGTNWQTDLLGAVGNGTYTHTPANLNRIGFGMAGSSFPFIGKIYEAFIVPGAHNPTQRAKQLAFLRDWHKAS